ncbi:MAG: MFS transporter, partial [Chitinophagaceae bacterium]|nr:MFS transporter [Chitinophagaceae bacterium]
MQSEKGIWKVIAASSVGTLIEWYDFYIFGSLAIIISEKFFPPENTTTAFLATLATFAAGFIVRPFGALFFGRLGDMIGRKYTFLLTLIIMGGSTFLIGCIPSYQTFHFAPYVILFLRLLQGLALGGEYGGAATYVAEHAPEHKRGYYTSWIQTTATLGLLVSLVVIITTQNSLSKADFNNWGWRLPFLLSIVLVLVSIIIRLKMKESPLFAKLKTEGKTSINPIKESFGKRQNLKLVLLALFGATMGQGVIWYTGQFYTQTFLLKTCNLNAIQTNTWLGVALILATPFFIFFGWLSDKIGRKVILLTGMLLAVFLYRPIFSELYSITNTKNKQEITTNIHISKTVVLNNTADSLITKTTTTNFTDKTVLIETEKYVESVVKTGNNQPKESKKIITL